MIHRSNEDFYGELKFFTSHFSHGDVYSFPLAKFGYDKKQVLAFKIIPPYSSDALVNQITEYLQTLFEH